ncbi:MAG: DUF4367 domain-containing protein [Anaerovoracaceae bacterium]
MENTDKKYKELINEKSHANMKYIAKRIIEMRSEEDDEIIKAYDEEKLPPVPEEIYSDMMKAAEEFDSLRAKELVRKKRKRRMKILSRCAVILVCFCIVGGLIIAPADAWKLRFMNLFSSDKDDHVEIRPHDTEALDGWNDYYIFSEVPDGYELTYAEDDGVDKILVYENGENQLILEKKDPQTAINVDNEKTNNKKINVNGKDALLFYSGEENIKMLMWLNNDELMEITSSGPDCISDENLVDLAENLKYIE